MSMLSFILILNHSFKSMTNSFEIGSLEIFHPLQEERECSIFFVCLLHLFLIKHQSKIEKKNKHRSWAIVLWGQYANFATAR